MAHHYSPYITMQRYCKSVNAFKLRTKRKIVEQMKKAKENPGKSDANEGLTVDEIRERDKQRVQEKQRAFEEKQKLEAKQKNKK